MAKKTLSDSQRSATGESESEASIRISKRNENEEITFRALLKVQGKKELVSLLDAKERLRLRNLDMAAYLRSTGVELPEYYRTFTFTPAVRPGRKGSPCLTPSSGCCASPPHHRPPSPRTRSRSTKVRRCERCQRCPRSPR
jgi:hypothetical protein